MSFKGKWNRYSKNEEMSNFKGNMKFLKKSLNKNE